MSQIHTPCGHASLPQPARSHLSKRWLTALVVAAFLPAPASEEWARFRGPNGQGIGLRGRPPVRFGADTNLCWKVPVAPGHSSPCIWGERIFLTSCVGQQFRTACFERDTGRLRWHRTIEIEQLPRLHKINNPASGTPTADGRHVVIFSGSFGLVGYDFDGKELWQRPFPRSKSYNGDAASPIMAEGKVILNCDWERGSFIAAYDPATGRELWNTPRRRYTSGYSTPCLLQRPERSEVVVPGSVWLTAYDLDTGAETWRCSELPGLAVCPSPAIGDGLVYSGGLNESFAVLEPWSKLLERYDANRDRALVLDEFRAIDPKDQETAETDRDAMPALDANNDGVLTEAEYRVVYDKSAPGLGNLFAVRPDKSGEVSPNHVVWRYNRGLSRVTSPLFLDHRLYFVSSGGLITCLDAATGKAIYAQERLGADGEYYASPVTANGHLYLSSIRGVITVIRAGEALDVVARNDLREGITATPAIAGDRIFVRTEKHLWAFGNPGTIQGTP